MFAGFAIVMFCPPPSRHAAEAWPNGLENRAQGQDHQHGSHSALRGVHGDPDTTRHGPGKNLGITRGPYVISLDLMLTYFKLGRSHQKLGK